VYATEMVKLGSVRTRARSAFGNVALLLFLLAQLFDGVLTYIGVNTFGLHAEGNPVIAWLMGSLGNGPGLATAKLAAVCFGIALYMSDVHKAVAALAGFYLLVAVGPWIALLFFWNA
jgi:uncharacterized membrane protein